MVVLPPLVCNNSYMNTSTPTNLSRGDVLTYDGQAVEVLAVDADPAADVWVAFLSNPDQDAFVPRSALSVRS